MTNNQNLWYSRVDTIVGFSISVLLMLVTFDVFYVSEFTYAIITTLYVISGIIYSVLANKAQFNFTMSGKLNPVWLTGTYALTTIFVFLMIVFGQVDYGRIWMSSLILLIVVGFLAGQVKK